jgi:mannose-6-phosphate isomerase-like protein (cupin superfamily)
VRAAEAGRFGAKIRSVSLSFDDGYRLDPTDIGPKQMPRRAVCVQPDRLLSDGRRRSDVNYKAINFQQKFELFNEQWLPKVVAEMNDYQFKVVKLQGDFIWHDHKDTDETFIVVDGDLRIDFREGAVHVSTGEMFVVPKGVEHKPYAEHEVKLLLIEPRGVLNTGHEGGDRTAANDVWI